MTPATDESISMDFAKIKLGIQSLEDAIFNLGDYKKLSPTLSNKETVQRAIQANDTVTLREISNFYYRISGIYQKLCRYLANLYNYDWLVVPYINDSAKETQKDKAVRQFNTVLNFLDGFGLKKFCSDTALQVIKDGSYYCYLMEQQDKTVAIQELPINYCRSRFKVDGLPVVELNMKYFDDAFRDVEQRIRILNIFPAEIKKGYALYKDGKLPPQFTGDQAGWYILDPEKTFKFNINGDDSPLFVSMIPALIDLDAAQALDRKKMLQKLLKIIIQKMPTDKNGDLLFDVEEAKDLHNNAVRMLNKAVGVDVLTTFADVTVADLADRNSTATTDELEKVERTAYNESGVAQNLFNSSGNLALDKSVLNDEALMYNLVLQFELFINKRLLVRFNKSKKLQFKAQILSTTIYNYKELSKMFKEQTQLGYSKMLPAIALGQSQSSILASVKFENEYLELNKLFVPPMSSNTMSADALKGDNDEVGRKEKPDDEKSEKTIANKESMS